MSNSSNNSDVEDVLSSVRRLVSGELPPAPRPRPSKTLLLQPTQRVAEARPRSEGRSLEDRIAELEAELAGRGDEWEPDGSEDPALHRPSAVVRFGSERAASVPHPGAGEDGAADASADGPASGASERETLRTLRRLSRIELIETGPANDPPNAPVTWPPEDPANADGRGDAEDAKAEPAADRQMRDAEATPAMARDAATGDEPAPTFGDHQDQAQDPEFDYDDELAEAGTPEAEDAGRDALAALPEPETDIGHAPDAVHPQKTSPDETMPKDIAAVVARSVSEAFDELAGDLARAPDGEDAAPAAAEGETPTADVVEAPVAPGDAPRPEGHDDEPVAPVAVAPVAPDFAIPEVAADRHDPDDPDEATGDAPQDLPGEGGEGGMPSTDAMRALVAELLREELQGELGERITRNVRKLVRREISRALAARDLS